MANLIPPSIMAVVYGATGNVSIGGLFLAGIVPGVLIGIGLMIYSHFFGPTGIPQAARDAVRIRRRRARLDAAADDPADHHGRHPDRMVHADRGRHGRVGLYPGRCWSRCSARGHIRHLPRDFVYTGLLYSIPLALVAAASAFGWMLAYLRGPDIVSGWIELFAGHDGRLIMLLLVLLFIVIGDFMDAVPAIIIFMPIVIKLNELGSIKPLHMGVVLITTLVFGLITPPYGLSLLVASKFVGVSFSKAMFASLPIYVVFLVTIAFTVLFPDVVLYLPKLLLPESVGCFKSPSGSRLHLPAMTVAVRLRFINSGKACIFCGRINLP